MRALHHPDVRSVELPTLLSALADPVRLSVVRQLSESGGIACGEFEALSLVSMSTLSHHLKILREAGILRVVAQGSFRRHELRADEVNARFPGILSAVIANLNTSEFAGA
jgi:DNA-binding transcriptional ArsR family regulator